MKGVSIVAVSDLHGELGGLAESARDADILVLAGDIQPAQMGVDSGAWFRGVFYPMVAEIGCEVVAICGNHDFHLANALNRADGMKGAPPNFHLLMDSGIELMGLKFWGSPWCPWINGRWYFEEDDEDIFDRFNQMPQGIDVLLTHTPPRLQTKKGDAGHQNDIDVSLECGGCEHFGSASLLDVVKRKSPSVLFCGHIHSGSHAPAIVTGDTRNTVCYNVSRLDEAYRIAYSPRRIEIRDRSIVEIGGGEHI